MMSDKTQEQAVMEGWNDQQRFAYLIVKHNFQYVPAGALKAPVLQLFIVLIA